MRQYDVLQQFLIQWHLVRHIENFTGKKLALVRFGTLQSAGKLEFPFLLVGRICKCVLIGGCTRTRVLRYRERWELNKLRTKQLFGRDGIAGPLFRHDVRGDRHCTQELLCACEGFDDQVGALAGLHANLGS